MAERHRETIPPFTGLVRFQTLLTDASVHDDERVGQGYDILKQKDRSAAGASVPAKGLFLSKVEYSEDSISQGIDSGKLFFFGI